MRTVPFDETEWQLVPKNPTFLMIEAGGEAFGLGTWNMRIF
jgi:hypothetical protein